MRRSGISISLFTLILGCCSSPLLADEYTGFEQHGKHEHGVATLSISVSNDGADILLDSPAINLTGFEHMPGSNDDKQHLNDVVKKLENGDELFTLNPEAGCELKDTEVLSGLLGDKLDEDEEHAEHGHQDMEVTWSYACATPRQLKDIQTKLFSAFPGGFQHIKAEWVTDSGASAAELTQDGNIKLE